VNEKEENRGRTREREREDVLTSLGLVPGWAGFKAVPVNLKSHVFLRATKSRRRSSPACVHPPYLSLSLFLFLSLGHGRT